jgi:serine phosphatase RsbU (regulator of sigma subunit)
MQEDLFTEIYDLRKKVKAFKTKEDLATCLLNFLKEKQQKFDFLGFLTIDEHNLTFLFGLSNYSTELLKSNKVSFIEKIQEHSGHELSNKNIHFYIEELLSKNDNIIFEKMKVFPMLFDEKMHGALIVFVDDESNYFLKICEMINWIFQERFFVVTNKYWQVLNKKLEAINEAREMMYSIISLSDMLSILGDIVLKYFSKTDMGLVLLKDTDEKFLTSSSWNSLSGYTKDLKNLFLIDFPYSVDRIYLGNKGFLLDAIKNEHKIIKLDSVKVLKNKEDITDIEMIIPELLVVPLLERNNIIGSIILIRTEFYKEKWNKNDISVIETISSLAASSIVNNRLHEQALQEEMTKKDLQVAHNIQKSMQAKIRCHLNNFDVSAVSYPAKAIGGDYYDFFYLSNDKLGVTMTDIVGKGIPAALIMAFFKGIMQISVTSALSASEMFHAVSNNLYINKSVKNYIPTVFGIIDDESMTFTYSNAGHENPLYYQSSSDSFKILEVGGFPLGAFKDSFYEEEVIKLEKDDIVCLFTDGITEARNIYQEDYGEDRLKELLKKYRDLSSEDLVNKIYSEVSIYSEGVSPHDDFTVMIIKRIR